MKNWASGRKISLLRDQDVDDLAVLVNRPVQIHPPPGDFHIRLVDAPAIAGCRPAGACRVDQQRGEPLQGNSHRSRPKPDFRT